MAILSNLPATQWAAALFATGAVAAAGWWSVSRWRSRPEQDLEAARQQFEAGDWVGALELVQRLRPAETAAPAPWHESRRLLEGECLVAASEAALRERRFADALNRYRDAAMMLELSAADSARRMVEAMLGELRRLSVQEPGSPALPELAALTCEQQPQCAEALFSRGLYHLRIGNPSAAITDLTAAHANCHGLQVDPALYLGAIWLRDGKPRNALRMLVEANKLAPKCPLVVWQLGMALLASGGDALLAVRALQKATGPDGIVQFLAEPSRLWIDTLPRDSWIRNVVRRSGAQRGSFVCPLGLDRLKTVLESARLALATALIDCRRPGEAATLFQELLRSRDDLDVHRGLGLAFADLERFDDALPHLRRAQSLESPAQSRTIGALAHCLAHAGGDRIGNVQQALALIGSPVVNIDGNWSRNASAVIVAAQTSGIAVPPRQIVDLANALVAREAADSAAASVYDLLALRDPDAVPIEAAWLYVRAAERESVCLSSDDGLFEAAFGDRAGMLQYFDAREWDFAAAERLYLHRWAERHPGEIPAGPGPNYRAGVEANLLSEAERHLAQNQLESAQAPLDLALKLSPTSPRVHDRLAELAYRRGHFDQSVDWLERWERLDPTNSLPATRLGLVRHKQGHLDDARRHLNRALEIARGAARGPIALAAARLAVASGQLREALAFVEECLTFDSENVVALAVQTALLVELGETSKVGPLVPTLSELNVEDARVNHLIGVAAYIGSNDDLARNRAKICSRHPETEAQAHYLMALLDLRRKQPADAMAELRAAIDCAQGLTEESARALRGQLAWTAGQYAEALRSWQPIPGNRLKARGLDSLIPGTAFLAGLSAFRARQFDDAAKWLRAAARLGFAHPRLDDLLAGAVDNPDPKLVAARLESALESAGPRPHIVRRLARSYRQLERSADAQRLLDSVKQPESMLLAERGLLHLAAGQLILAERAFVESLSLDSANGLSAVNLLLTRLTLGRLDDAKAILPNATELAPTPNIKRICQLLAGLTAVPPRAGDSWTADDDDALIEFLRSVGRFDTVDALMTALVQVRGVGRSVRKAQADLLPLQIKQRLDWGDAAGVLRTFGPAAASASPAVRNLLGVAAALRQDFEGAIRHFEAALPNDGTDARIQQNLAIVRGRQGRNREAIEHWRRFLGLIDKQVARPKGMRDYHRRIGDLVQAKLKELEASDS